VNLSTATWAGTLFIIVLLFNSFLFWWAFFEEETLEFDIGNTKDFVDPLMAFPIFIEWNLRKLYLLQIKCQFMVTFASLVRQSMSRLCVTTLLRANGEEV